MWVEVVSCEVGRGKKVVMRAVQSCFKLQYYNGGEFGFEEEEVICF